MTRLIILLKISLFLLFTISLLAIGSLGYTLWKYSPELPSYEKIKNYQPNLSSRIYTSDGLLLDKFFVQERIFVPIKIIPDNFRTVIPKLLVREGDQVKIGDKLFFDK